MEENIQICRENNIISDAVTQHVTSIEKFKIREVSDAIQKIDSKKAPGYDLITGKLLKELSFVSPVFNIHIQCYPTYLLCFTSVESG